MTSIELNEQMFDNTMKNNMDTATTTTTTSATTTTTTKSSLKPDVVVNHCTPIPSQGNLSKKIPEFVKRRKSAPSAFLSSTSSSGSAAAHSTEQIVNQMEKEQDRMVITLLREIQYLQYENGIYKQKLNSIMDTKDMNKFMSMHQLGSGFNSLSGSVNGSVISGVITQEESPLTSPMPSRRSSWNKQQGTGQVVGYAGQGGNSYRRRSSSTSYGNANGPTAQVPKLGEVLKRNKKNLDNSMEKGNTQKGKKENGACTAEEEEEEEEEDMMMMMMMMMKL
ncbi:hypothetical protein ACO0QE_002918 [Hanseniaspora vineae]